jgi:hypothetical protein
MRGILPGRLAVGLAGVFSLLPLTYTLASGVQSCRISGTGTEGIDWELARVFMRETCGVGHGLPLMIPH